MREVFLTVPRALKESAYALGSTRWEVVWDVVLPYTRSAVIGGDLPRPRPRARRNDGGDVRARQRARAVRVAAEPGNSIAATIANEFTEADSDIYRSSLIALGFVLFIVTFIVLRIAKLMLLRISSQHGRTDDERRRRTLAAPRDEPRCSALRERWRPLFGLFWLVWILWTTLRNGIAALNPALFTKMTPPPGADGGLLNAFFGSVVMSLLGDGDRRADRRRCRHLPRRVRAEDRALGETIRFVNDILLSAPSIVLGLFVYTLVVRTDRALLRAGRRASRSRSSCCRSSCARPTRCCGWCRRRCAKPRSRSACRSGR